MGENAAKCSSNDRVFSGYLDVKISTKKRRGLTPWKAWHKRWCEIRRMDDIENGLELHVKTSPEGTTINRLVLPRSSTVCRINSRSKQYAFGVFALTRNQKPLLFLSGYCEMHTQQWMFFIRRTLSIASYLPIGKINFYYVSLVDNDHSRSAGLSGLFGILSVGTQDITVSDPVTGEVVVKWKWHQFHQFHLQAVSNLADEGKICVFHTSREFAAGAGQLYFFCENATGLLNLLVSRGKHSGSRNYKKLSQSEGDLIKLIDEGEDCYNSRRKSSDSNDSGVRISLSLSDDSGGIANQSISSVVGLMSKTPGGSEDEDDEQSECQEIVKASIPRGVSGISLASGVYEEIPEDVIPTKNKKTAEIANVYTNSHMIHLYEDPLDVRSSRSSFNNKLSPPPLPPRSFSILRKNCDTFKNDSINNYKYRSRTLPTKDLKRLSQNFAAETEYMVMSSPARNCKLKCNPEVCNESMYVPMSPIANLKTKLENCYMVMSGKRC